MKEIVDAILAEYPDELKVTPGKMVYEIQPKLDWDKGKAGLYLLEVLRLDRDDVVPLYLGDDITDEDAFEALADRGINILVGRADDSEVAGRTPPPITDSTRRRKCRQFLDTLGVRRKRERGNVREEEGEEQIHRVDLDARLRFLRSR